MKFIDLNSAVISMLQVPERREIFVGTYTHLIILNWEFEIFQKIEIGRPVRAIAADQKGNVFVGLSSSHGDTLLKIDRERNAKFVSTDESLNILSLCVDKNDDLWIGTLGSGLFKFDGYELEAYNGYNSDVNDDTIFSLFPDRTGRGNIWFGCKVHGFGLTDVADMFEDRYSLSPMMLEMMLPEYGYKRYLIKRHHNPGGEYLNCQIWDKQIMKEEYEASYMKEISEEEYFEDEYDDDFEDYENENEEEKSKIEFSGYVKSIVIDDNQTMWLGTVNSGIIKFRWRERNVIFHTDNSKIPDNDIYVLAIEPNGTLWAGTDNGLIRIENDEVTTFTVDNSPLKCNEIRSLAIVNNHILVGYNHTGGNPFALLSGGNEKPGGLSVLKITELINPSV